MNAGETKNFTQRFSKQNLAFLMSIGKPPETYSDMLAKVIAYHSEKRGCGEVIDFEKLRKQDVPEEIESMDLGLKTNAINFKLTIQDFDFIEEEMENYQRVNNMVRPPRLTWFIGQVVTAYYFQEIKNIDVYIEELDKKEEMTLVFLNGGFSEQEQPDIRSHILSIRHECDILLQLLDCQGVVP